MLLKENKNSKLLDAVIENCVVLCALAICWRYKKLTVGDCCMLKLKMAGNQC